MDRTEINHEIMLKQIKKLHNWKHASPDRIHNYWLKRLTTLHNEIIQTFNNLIEDPENISEEICQGKTFLKPKNENTHDPTNYRPITYLNTLYKLLTGCVAQIITKHIENKNILAQE